MKVIHPDKITAVAADEQNAEYPVANVLDSHPKKVWRATSADAKLTVSVAAGANAVAVFGTNARTISYVVKDGDGITVEAGSFSLSGIDTLLELLTDAGEAWTELWIDYAYQDMAHSIELTLDSGSGIVEAGVVRAGLCRWFVEPVNGLKEGLIDYGIEHELNNGAIYYRKRDVVRTFAGRIVPSRDGDFYTFMRTVFKNVGAAPLAWQMTSDAGHTWTVFARAKKGALPGGEHALPAHSPIDFTLYEVV